MGPERLSEAELVAVVLGTGRAGESVHRLALRLLEEAGGLQGLARMGTGALQRWAGLGPAKATRLVAALELGRRLMAMPPRDDAPLVGPREVARRVGPALLHLEHERFVALALDARHRLLRQIEVARGGSTGVEVDVASVFRSLLREGAVAAIFVHNHPSGCPRPSREDAWLTERLAEAGRLLGIRVLDHVVVARGGHYSFAEAGLLPGRWSAGPGARGADRGMSGAHGREPAA